jgi:autotransporter-associated beta strand protein
MIAERYHRPGRAVGAGSSARLPVAGACALALLSGLAGTAGASGIEIDGGSSPGLSNAAAIDYILIHNGATVSGNVENAATGQIAGTADHSGIGVYDSTINAALINRGGIGSATLANYAIEIRDSAITGGIVNYGSLSSSYAAILVDAASSSFSGGIANLGSGAGIASAAEGISVNVDGYSGGIANAGSIQGALTAVSVTANTFAGGVTNSGTISSDGNAGIRVYANEYSGGLGNSGTVTAATDYGIYLDIGTANGNLTNSGTVTSADDAIHVQGGSVIGGLSNEGTLSSADRNGVFVQLDSLSGGITSSGTLSAARNGMSVDVATFQGGIINSGSIDSGLSGIAVSATSFTGGITNTNTILSSDDMGIRVDASSFAGGVANSGSMTAELTGIALYADQIDGDIVNSGSIVSNAGQGIAIETATWFPEAPALGGKIINSGSILGADCGVCVAGFAVAEGLVNSGTIRGATVAIQTGDGADLVVNSGSIIGDSGSAIDLGGGDDRLRIAGGSAGIQGDISGGAGSNVLEFAPGAGQTFSYAGAISNFARVTVASGTVRLSGASDYAGTTHIDGGTLSVDNTTGSATGSGAVTVHAGGTLAGNGSVAGSVTVEGGGVLSPGNSIGELSVGDLSLASSAVLAIALDPVQGTNDLVRVGGGVALDLADLVLSLLSAPTPGQWLDILLNDGPDAIVGRFAQGDRVAASFAGRGYLFAIRYDGNADGGAFGNDLRLESIPEPSTLLLLGFVALAFARRRDRT